MSKGLSSLFQYLSRKRFNHSLVVGIIASALDWLTLVGLVRLVHLTPQWANFPSLLVGSTIQFIGNRNFVFKATHRKVQKQAMEFAMVEVVAFFLNGTLFHVLVTYTSINYALARPLGSFAVFAGFSYPLWRFVFRTKILDPAIDHESA